MSDHNEGPGWPERFRSRLITTVLTGLFVVFSVAFGVWLHVEMRHVRDTVRNFEWRIEQGSGTQNNGHTAW